MMTHHGVSSGARRQILRVLYLLALALLSACATTPSPPPAYCAHPPLEERLRGAMTVALLPPQVKVYRVTATETAEPMEEWTETARRNIEAAIAKRLKTERQLTVREFDSTMSEATREEFEDAISLSQVVILSANLHAKVRILGVDRQTYDPPIQFKTKMECFDYTLGPLPLLAEASRADALLFVQAVDQISTGARVARIVVYNILNSIPLSQGIVMLRGSLPGVTAMSAALVDAHTGDILWFNRHATPGVRDLRDPASAEKFVADAFESFASTSSSSKPPTKSRE